MADVFAEVNEAMKQERLQNLWDKYGILIIGLIAVLILGTIGNEAYKSWKDNRNLEQTRQMLTILEGENKAEVIKQAQTLQPGLKGLVLISTAGGLARQGDIEEAFKIYSGIVTDLSLPDDIRALADFMVLRLMLQTEAGKSIAPEKIISGLEKVWNKPGSPLRHHARLEAAVILAENIGNYVDAKAHLQFLASEEGVPDTLRQKAVSLDVLYSLKNEMNN